MVTKEQLRNALNVIEEYKKQVNTSTESSCNHRGAWITVKGHLYCPKCDFAYNTFECKMCNGKGGFDVGIEPNNESKKSSNV